jgi:hypothetical protein
MICIAFVLGQMCAKQSIFRYHTEPRGKLMVFK